LGGNVAAGAWPVLNNELLTEPLREPLSYQTRDDVTRTAGAIADEDAHRPRRIGLRPRKPRDGRERGGAGGQLQKLVSVGKFHHVASLKCYRIYSPLMFAALMMGVQRAISLFTSAASGC